MSRTESRCPFRRTQFIAYRLAIIVPVLVNSAGFAAEQRARWTTSRVVGSPEPPLPYTVEEAFPAIDWERPIYAKAEPGTDSLFVVSLGAQDADKSTVVRLQDNSAAHSCETLLEIDGRVVYGLEFAPDYHAGGHLFVFSNGPTRETERKNRISRFNVSSSGERLVDPDSELVILEWRSMGHDGGDLVFGHDGMLYVTSGDGTTDSDTWLSAQDVSNLLGGVLRIDVRAATAEKPYLIPSDNPFLETENARGELWAFGLRNPWRMCIDERSGDIWIGNNGQDLWETAHLLIRGANYGWSVFEGSHPFYLNRQRGPAEIVPPTIEHHHIEFRSLTGGVVYYGDTLSELAGAYVYGDYATGKIWGARHSGEDLTWHRELADTTLQIAGFAVSPNNDLLIMDHASGIYRLRRADIVKQPHEFPGRLSETGLFNSTADHEVAAGVVPYEVNAEGWTDGATSERFIALPGDTRMTYKDEGGWDFPDGAVLMQTLRWPATSSGSQPRRIETRILTRQRGDWAGYSYLWNDLQDDALLVPRAGDELKSAAFAAHTDSPGTWRVPSRAECMSCHSRAANFVLGLSTVQFNRQRSGSKENQLRHFAEQGFFSNEIPAEISAEPSLVDPYGETHEFETRARSYLHANCAACHVRAGGGNARMELDFRTPRDKMELLSVYPQHSTFGIQQALLVAPGAPQRSILFHRISRRGSGQMPPLVTNVVDQRAVKLFHDWIAKMEVQTKFVKNWRVADLQALLKELAGQQPSESGKQLYTKLGCHQCHRLRGDGGGAGPDLSDLAKRAKPIEVLESIVVPSQKVAAEFATTVIQTTDGRTLMGRIEARETGSEILLRTGDAFAPPIEIAKAEIEERVLSQQSIMPAGLLNSLEEQEIVELLVYLLGEPL